MRTVLIVLGAGVLFGAGIVAGGILKLWPDPSPAARVVEAKGKAQDVDAPAVRIGDTVDPRQAGGMAIPAEMEVLRRNMVETKADRAADPRSKEVLEKILELSDPTKSDTSVKPDWVEKIDSVGLTEAQKEQVRSQMEMERARIAERMRAETDAASWEEYRMLKSRGSYRLSGDDRARLAQLNERFRVIQEQVLGQWDGASAYQGLPREQREAIEPLRGGFLQVGADGGPEVREAGPPRIIRAMEQALSKSK